MRKRIAAALGLHEETAMEAAYHLRSAYLHRNTGHEKKRQQGQQQQRRELRRQKPIGKLISLCSINPPSDVLDDEVDQ